MRPFGWLGAILGITAILVAGAIGFSLGTTTTVPADGAVTLVAWGFPLWGLPFFPLFGFLSLIVIIALVTRGSRRAAWAGRPSWHDHGRWEPGAMHGSDPRRQAFEEWHRQAHAGPASDASTQDPSTTPR